jgi:hypothetical protein
MSLGHDQPNTRDRTTVDRVTEATGTIITTETSSGAVAASVYIPSDALADAIEAVRADLDAELRQLAGQAGGCETDE